MKEEAEDKINSIIEILKGVEYREITNIIKSVEEYIENKKRLNRLS